VVALYVANSIDELDETAEFVREANYVKLMTHVQTKDKAVLSNSTYHNYYKLNYFGLFDEPTFPILIF
jgi:hypothetical protein